MDKAILLLLLMANLINSANLVAKEVRENEIQTNSYMENPDFNYSVKQKIVNLKGDYSFLNNNSQYVVSNVIVSVKDKDSSTFITSLDAKYSKNLNLIEFLNSVSLKTDKNTNSFLINSEFLQYNLSDSTLYTNQKVKTIFNEVLLESDGLKLITDSRGINAVFDKSSVQISNLQSLDKGYADKIILSSDDNILILEGKASFNQEDMIIKSDLIHYDYLEKKIIKSINSQIQNQI
ncbi:MAG: hypothetical protein EVA50_02915 [Gammaproteobacteria bacterium]|nr:MAG: hypothetical protein EVA50_02915 [Gammaproteobacteria bacterium]